MSESLSGPNHIIDEHLRESLNEPNHSIDGHRSESLSGPNHSTDEHLSESLSEPNHIIDEHLWESLSGPNHSIDEHLSKSFSGPKHSINGQWGYCGCGGNIFFLHFSTFLYGLSIITFGAGNLVYWVDRGAMFEWCLPSWSSVRHSLSQKCAIPEIVVCCFLGK